MIQNLQIQLEWLEINVDNAQRAGFSQKEKYVSIPTQFFFKRSSCATIALGMVGELELQLYRKHNIAGIEKNDEVATEITSSAAISDKAILAIDFAGNLLLVILFIVLFS